jgi:putative methionine-R-sulfoxide reductase with GAF domain
MSSQDPQAAPVQPVPPPNERRGRTRHPISVPATVRLRGPGLAAASTHLVDLSEDGVGVHSSIPLQMERTLGLDLDLNPDQRPELSGTSYIRLIGQVAWTSPDGRAGVRFFSLDQASLHSIQQWLFLNAVADATVGSRLPEVLSLADPRSGLQSAAQSHAQPERFSDEDDADDEDGLSPLARDINAIVSRALALTGAKGAALALYEGDQLICRATCGTDTPGLGALISTDSGITGECIRFAQVMYCSDASSDPRVNQEICADLGIRSILALPLFAGQRIVGLLEVLSQRSKAFDPGDAKALDLMARPVMGQMFAEGESESLRSGVGRDMGSNVAAPEPTTGDLDVAALERRRRQVAGSVLLGNHLVRRAFAAVAVVAVIGAVTWLIFSQTKMLASLRQPTVIATSEIPAQVPHLSDPSSTPVPAAMRSIEAKPDPGKPSDPKADAPSLQELKVAAQSGEPSAQYAMGARYATGEGVQQDYATAARWFTLAAKNGYAPAQGMLGAYYWSGRGLHKDLKQAYFWSVLARDGNDEISKDRVDSLMAQLNTNEMLQVQELVRDWYRKHSATSPVTAASSITR